MADYTTRTRTRVTKEWVLPNPTIGQQVSLVLGIIRDWLKSQGVREFDDTIRVSGDATEIIFSVEAADNLRSEILLPETPSRGV